MNIMERKKYHPEGILIQKVQSGEYGWKEYIEHHSKELNDEYENYCKFHAYDPNEEESAAKFMEMKEVELEEAFDTENV